MLAIRNQRFKIIVPSPPIMKYHNILNLSMMNARRAFSLLPTRVSKSTESQIVELCNKAQLDQATTLLKSHKASLHYQTYTILLETCTKSRSVAHGKKVHKHILANTRVVSLFHSCKLVQMYISCGNLMEAKQVFDNTTNPNIFMWNGILIGYAKKNFCNEAIDLFKRMQCHGHVIPDRYSYPSILKACSGLGLLEYGKQIHGRVVREAWHSNVIVASSLVGMYGKCHSIDNARRLFDNMQERDVTMWNSLISGYIQVCLFDDAIEIYQTMKSGNTIPDPHTFTSILYACGRLGDVGFGMRVHEDITKCGLEFNLPCATALVDMYGKNENMEFARQVFDKIPTRNESIYNSLIGAYVHNSLFGDALRVFSNMQGEIRPDEITLTSTLAACSGSSSLIEGYAVHCEVIKRGYEKDVFVASALVDMYVKCGRFGKARHVFNDMVTKNVVSWNVMMGGYATHGKGDEALGLLRSMQDAGVRQDAVTYTNFLPACCALQHGREIHHHVVVDGLGHDRFISAALLDMYVRCGGLDDARRLFDNVPHKDVISWTSMISGYGVHGRGEDALSLFNQMRQAGVVPDNVTFITVLSACSHMGLVNEGLDCFKKMWKCGVEPSVEHYACVVDLLGRAGRLTEALDIIKSMPFRPDKALLSSLLAACRIHNNVEMGEYVGSILLQK